VKGLNDLTHEPLSRVAIKEISGEKEKSLTLLETDQFSAKQVTSIIIQKCRKCTETTSGTEG